MKTSIFSKLAVMCALVMVTLSFAACSEDDETVNLYSMGITYQYYFSSSRDTLKMTMREEMNAIDSAYLKALGVSDKTFTLQGSVSDCDNQVKQACAAAEAALSQLSFHGSYTYTVYNNTSSSTSTAIYTYNINR